jgi:hypothetical protein
LEQYYNLVRLFEHDLRSTIRSSIYRR